MPASDEIMAFLDIAIKEHLPVGFQLRHGRNMRGTPVFMNRDYRKVTIQNSDGSGRTFLISEISVFEWPPEVMGAIGQFRKFKGKPPPYPPPPEKDTKD